MPLRRTGLSKPGSGTADHIVAVARSCFAEHGFRGASTRMVADAAGVNVATLAYHFGGKQGLYDAVIDAVYRDLLDASAGLVIEGNDEESRVRNLLARILGIARAHAADIRLLLRHVMASKRLPERARSTWQDAMLARGLALADSVLDPGRSRPDLPLVLLSLNHLVARYAVMTDEDLAVFSGSEPVEAVARHLGDVALLLLR